MLFSLQVATFLAMTVIGTQALPSAEPVPAVGDIVSDLRVVQVDYQDDGVMTWYGESGGSPNPGNVLTRRVECTNYIATCNGAAGGSHLAPKSTCTKLINKLGTNVGKFPKSPRSLCIKDKAGKCCVSWSKVPSSVKTLKKNALWRPADLIYSACTDPKKKKISGRNTSAKLGDECIVVCLSNRPDGCN